MTNERQFIEWRLADRPYVPYNPEDRAASAAWKPLLHEGSTDPAGDFHMLGRLAEKLLTANPQILRALLPLCRRAYRLPQQRLYFLPLPQEQRSLGAILALLNATVLRLGDRAIARS